MTGLREMESSNVWLNKLCAVTAGVTLKEGADRKWVLLWRWQHTPQMWETLLKYKIQKQGQDERKLSRFDLVETSNWWCRSPCIFRNNMCEFTRMSLKSELWMWDTYLVSGPGGWCRCLDRSEALVRMEGAPHMIPGGGPRTHIHRVLLQFWSRPDPEYTFGLLVALLCITKTICPI